MKYRQCNRCVMDTTADGIHFDDEGNCNFCSDFIRKFNPIKKNSDDLKKELDIFVKKLKQEGENKKYDCIVGVSGGIDSSYSLYLAKKMGLRVLAVHMDNGWNSEIAINNIERLVTKLDVDLYTHVIDWQEYKKLMEAFFQSDVIDVEMLYDNAMLSVNYQLANKYDIKYILSGSNTSTEGMIIPENWSWYKYDKKNIKNIASSLNVKMKTFPIIGTFDYIYYRVFKRISWVHFLDYFNYNKQEAIDFLKNEYGFKPYPYKHYESIFTRFYQGYILIDKFGIDKRKLHLSTLIASGQISREQALKDLQHIPYLSKNDLENDKAYFLKKMEWSASKLDDYIKREEKPHNYYGSEKNVWNFYSNIYRKYCA